MSSQGTNFHTIILPVRPQPDTIAAIFVLKEFGEEKFPGIGLAKVEFCSLPPDGKSAEQFKCTPPRALPPTDRGSSF